MWKYNYVSCGEDYLAHHGIKGQKWHVRRTKEELAHDRESIAARINNVLRKGFKTFNGVEIKKLSEHALDRTQDKTRLVTAKEIMDALSKPLNRDTMALKHDHQGRSSYRFIGKDSTVSVNPETGVIITCWRTGRKDRKKYGIEE